MCIDITYALLDIYVTGFGVKNLISTENCAQGENYRCSVRFSAGEMILWVVRVSFFCFKGLVGMRF